MKNNLGMRVSIVTIIINILLSAGKLLAGILGHSSAMISDAVHTASDVLSTIIVMIGITASSRHADSNHPYGHERLECVASIILSSILLATGIGIGYTGCRTILSQSYNNISIPTLLPLLAAIVSIVTKEGMYWYTRKAAKILNSGALLADAWHHRSDALSSVGSFVGILGARLGFPILDSLASVVICLFIIKAAYDIFMDTIAKLTDHSCDESTENLVKEIILGTDGVMALDDLKTRLFGSKIYIDVEISADGNQSLEQAHAIAEVVHASIESTVPNVKHCTVHVNPVETAQ